MEEHVPHPILVRAMAVYFWATAAAALVFWLCALIWRGGIGGLMQSLGPGAITVFVIAHIFAAIVGVLLWQWRRHAMPPLRRVLLEGAALYFGVAVLFGLLMNAIAASILDLIS